MDTIQKVQAYLEDAGIFYVTTTEGDQPRCRPFSFQMVVDGQLYFGAGTFKAVYKQLQANPKIEICASKGEGFLRLYGTVVFDSDPTLVEKAKDILPMLRDIYNEETGNTLGIFHLENATAEFRGMMGLEETLTF